MSLTPGAKLGIYEIVDPLGTGGMGEVYRARDSKLGRDVAIKVLPEELSEHPDKLARFEREARLLAALNHPKIATLHGLEESGGKPFLVMELVEGETLAERIARGPLSVEEGLAVAHQIAEALEAAHEKGIIHRDLKPANIKVDAEGNVKVLDFGLAKAFAGDEAKDSDLSQSPTLSRDATRAGVILGTAAYMSPEQAKGKSVDKRTDIFSFGIVLFEMLTGKKAFEGEDVPEVLAAIINREPDWAPVDSRVDHLLRCCLRKDRRKRLRDIGDARNEIDDILAGPTAASMAHAPEITGRFSAGTTVAAALLLGVITGIAGWILKPESSRPLVRVVATPPFAEVDGVDIASPEVDVAITRDGSRIVYLAVSGGQRQIAVRALDQLDARFLAGLGDAPYGLFLSPDGGSIGYTAEGDLRKVSILGGPSVNIYESFGGSRGASWGSDDRIIFATNAARGLRRVPAGGGELEELTTPGPGEGSHLWPEILPGNEAVLFTIMGGTAENAQIALLSLLTGEIKVLVPGGSSPRYAPTGHIVYGMSGTLRAVGFDLDRLEVTSDPVPVLDGVVTKASGAADFAISNEGSLVYLAGSEQAGQDRTLVWVDREGREEVLAAEPRAYTYPRISPDGSQAVIDVRDEEQDLWIWDFARETLRRLTFDPAGDWYPIWAPDGRHVIFSSPRDGSRNLFWRATDGSSGVERLSESENTQYPYAVSRDGKLLVFGDRNSGRGDLGLRSLEGDAASGPLLSTEYSERNAEISSDGRWLAYESDASGQYEIYVRPFPNVDADLHQVSRGGGTRPLWSRDGGELFYLDRNGRLVTVTVRNEPALEFGNPEVVLEQSYYAPAGPPGRTYDVSPDGERFLMIKESGTTADAIPLELILVQNWLEELKRLVPTE